ncbi:unnamed protein product [Cladocopium goreaui]|uniref:Uncharacterized protein n=1 Tax=Cladocopium goreaui TaxID=2562237 RepID=A0A9P1FFR3_9DINO|nr:unnamed protein product [Cladocopium goreaui]
MTSRAKGPLALLSLAPTLAQQLPGVLTTLPSEELVDIDCLEVRSLHVDWANIRPFDRWPLEDAVEPI